MKIAIVTNDGETISQHFGRSRYYKIFTAEQNEIVADELRERGTGHFAPGANQPPHEDHTVHDPMGRHGYGTDADRKHFSMAQEIADCQVLIAGGMGSGAYESFKRAGLEVILTDHQVITESVNSYLKGTLVNLYQSRTD